jgi:iron complex outermembrane receptor protein
LHHSTGIIELGDLALDKEQAIKLSTTLQKNGLLSRLRLILNSIRNFMFLRPVDFETTTRGAFLGNTSRPMQD